MSPAAAILAGYSGDLLFGDPARWHPVAGLGRLSGALERRFYAPTRRRGAVHAGALLALPAAAAEVVARRSGRTATLAALTWAALGGRSLGRIALAIARDLDRGDLAAARGRLPALVGRDAAALDEAGVCRAVVESVAENTADAVVGTLLWAAVAGPAGVTAHRAANTLDAMIGHRTERYGRFGWAAARIDDALGLPVARLTAALTVACAPAVGGSPRRAAATLLRDGAAHPSPNAGRPEAAFAGALGVGLGGPLAYGGRTEHRPTLGDGRAPTPDDIRRAVRLLHAVGLAAALGLAAATRSRPGGGRR